jgi:demethylspheroidene O-methyltransferase
MRRPAGAEIPVAALTGGGLRDWLFAKRDRLLSRPAFQRWALRFLPTRAIARRRARELFDLCAGFVYSQTLLACVQLGLLEKLRDGPQSLEALARDLRLPRDALRALVRAAAALQLVRLPGGDQCALGALGAALLGNPALFAMIAHHQLLYRDLEDPLALLRAKGTSRLAQYWAYAGATRAQEIPAPRVRDYTALMSTSQALIGQQILDAYPLDRHRCLLDVGGGDGTFALLAAERVRRLRVICFDLPAVAQCARARFASSRFVDRASVMQGNFLSDPLPSGPDVISLVRVLHDHDDPAALTILRAARAALSPDGVVLIAEPLSGTRGGERAADAYFGWYLFAMGTGMPRTAARLTELLVEAGFKAPKLHATAVPMNVRVLTARIAPQQSAGYCVNVD